jgi:hypothetical protein
MAGVPLPSFTAADLASGLWQSWRFTCHKAHKRGLLPAGEKCPGCRRQGACLLKTGVWRPGLDGAGGAVPQPAEADDEPALEEAAATQSAKRQRFTPARFGQDEHVEEMAAWRIARVPEVASRWQPQASVSSSAPKASNSAARSGSFRTLHHALHSDCTTVHCGLKHAAVFGQLIKYPTASKVGKNAGYEGLIVCGA